MPKPTEYGGSDGMIQPPPHKPTPAEKLQLMYAIDPMDPVATVPN